MHDIVKKLILRFILRLRYDSQFLGMINNVVCWGTNMFSYNWRSSCADQNPSAELQFVTHFIFSRHLQFLAIWILHNNWIHCSVVDQRD